MTVMSELSSLGTALEKFIPEESPSLVDWLEMQNLIKKESKL